MYTNEKKNMENFNWFIFKNRLCFNKNKFVLRIFDFFIFSYTYGIRFKFVLYYLYKQLIYLKIKIVLRKINSRNVVKFFLFNFYTLKLKQNVPSQG